MRKYGWTEEEIHRTWFWRLPTDYRTFRPWGWCSLPSCDVSVLSNWSSRNPSPGTFMCAWINPFPHPAPPPRVWGMGLKDLSFLPWLGLSGDQLPFWSCLGVTSAEQRRLQPPRKFQGIQISASVPGSGTQYYNKRFSQHCHCSEVTGVGGVLCQEPGMKTKYHFLSPITTSQ